MSVETHVHDNAQTGSASSCCDQDGCGCGPQETSAPVFVPPIDVTDSGDEYTVVADLPGSSADQISVNFEKSVLSIDARVSARAGCCDGSALRTEYAVGDYRRSLRLGEDIDPQRITGEYTGGVLTLHLPKAEEARPRSIAIRAG